ncbi:hypothetical protein ACHQM5_000136 [Ranunculus cassubicifolius]
MKKKARDRISVLPDEVIHHMLSFMNVDEAVLTSCLSKRWRYQWTFIPNLCFQPYYDGSPPFREHTRGFPDTCRRSPLATTPYGNCNIDAITGCIRQYQAKQLQKLSIEVYETCDDVSLHIQEWFNFAIDRKVEDLTVLTPVGSNTNPLSWFKVSDSLFSSRCLQKLSLGYCKIYPPSDIKCFASLVSLCLTRFLDHDGALQSLLPKCYNLRFLHLVSYRGLGSRKLSKTSLSLPQVQKLHIGSGSIYHLIEICAPNLQNMRVIDGFFCNLRLRNSPHLQKAHLHIQDIRPSHLDLSPREHPLSLGSTLQNMANIKSLHLTHTAFKAMYTEDYMNGTRKFALNNLKELILDCIFMYETVYPIVNFLRSCPYLETLDIKYWGPSEPNMCVIVKQLASQPNDDDAKLSCDFHEYLFQCLKRVKLFGVGGDAKQMILVKFLLEKAAALDFLTVKYIVTIQDHIDFLLGYIYSVSKISPHATIESFGLG